MSTTPNYGLILHDNATIKFKQFREDISGETDSNMIKIDTALGNKAEKSQNISVILLASAWQGDSAPYSQTVSAPGVSGPDQNGFITISPNATEEQNNAAVAAIIGVAEQQVNQITVSCIGQKPEIDIPAVIVLIN